MLTWFPRLGSALETSGFIVISSAKAIPKKGRSLLVYKFRYKLLQLCDCGHTKQQHFPRYLGTGACLYSRTCGCHKFRKTGKKLKKEKVGGIEFRSKIPEKRRAPGKRRRPKRAS